MKDVKLCYSLPAEGGDPERGGTMDRKRAVVMNLVAIASVLLLALATMLLAKVLPTRVPEPNAGSPEESGIIFTLAEPGE